VKILTENLKKNIESCQLVVAKKNMIFQKKIFYYLMMKIFTRAQKLNETKKILFLF
jgi:hypothetical protein